jgi:hypothetical protein
VGERERVETDVGRDQQTGHEQGTAEVRHLNGERSVVEAGAEVVLEQLRVRPLREAEGGGRGDQVAGAEVARHPVEQREDHHRHRLVGAQDDGDEHAPEVREAGEAAQRAGNPVEAADVPGEAEDEAERRDLTHAERRGLLVGVEHPQQRYQRDVGERPDPKAGEGEEVERAGKRREEVSLHRRQPSSSHPRRSHERRVLAVCGGAALSASERSPATRFRVRCALWHAANTCRYRAFGAGLRVEP